MRTLARLLFSLAALALLVWFVQINWASLPWSTTAGNTDQTRIAQARTSPAYLLQSERWLEFTLSGNNNLIRLLSNATLAPEEAGATGVIWKYALEYQLLGDNDQIIDSRVYHQRSRLTWYLDDEQKPFTSSFYLDPGLIPSGAGEILLNPDGAHKAKRLRVRLHGHDPLIKDTVLRVYERERVAEQKLDYMWHRLNNQQRTALARGSVYGPDLLREAERHSLMRQRWQPVGPNGVNGRDYLSRIMYSLQSYEGQALDEPVLPAGLLVESRLRGIVGLPSGPGEARLEFIPVQLPAQTDNTQAELEIRWFGPGLAKRSVHHLQLKGDRAIFEHPFEGGLLEITSTSPVVVRATHRQPEVDPDIRREITPPPGYLRAYQADPSDPVVFAVDHFENRPTPFRVTLRRKLAADAEPAAGGDPDWPHELVEYRFLDARGRVVGQGHLQGAELLSEYDRLLNDETASLVTDPISYFIAVPAKVRQVAFFAEPDMLLTAYTRPAGIPSFTRIPEDIDLTGDKFERLPAWFLVQALDAKQLLQANRIAVLSTQPRPPEDNADILAGRYDWEGYTPNGNWRGRHILNPREPGVTLSTDSYAGIYRVLPIRQSVSLAFRGPTSRLTLNPTLIYLRPTSTPFKLRLLLDGKTLIEKNLSGRRGQLTLPAISQGRHRVELQSDGAASWLINHAGPGDSGHYKRLAQRLDSQGLDFSYEKQSAEEETLSIHVQTPMAHQQRTRLRVRVSATNRSLGFLNDWTLTDRVFDIAPSREGPIPVLNTRAEAVSLGQRFFLPLGCDLPAGSYRVRIELERGPGGYLSLYRLTPGIKAKHVFNKERLDDES